jgi:general secretion pathway protein B
VAEESPRDTVRPALPTLEQLQAGGIISVAPLHLDIHVFHAEPAQRFVFINMKKYREGERLTEGPIVEEITNDGVVLNHRGSRFTLDRT